MKDSHYTVYASQSIYLLHTTRFNPFLQLQTGGFGGENRQLLSVSVLHSTYDGRAGLFMTQFLGRQWLDQCVIIPIIPWCVSVTLLLHKKPSQAPLCSRLNNLTTI